MADTISDVKVDRDTYTNVYVEAGLSVGLPLLIQNKGQNVTLVESATQPSDDDSDGAVLGNLDWVKIDSGATGLWAKGSTRLSVQVNS